ncbi:hypothetical protein L9F63_022787, partial [Diploptera punctata]
DRLVVEVDDLFALAEGLSTSWMMNSTLSNGPDTLYINYYLTLFHIFSTIAEPIAKMIIPDVISISWLFCFGKDNK